MYVGSSLLVAIDMSFQKDVSQAFSVGSRRRYSDIVFLPSASYSGFSAFEFRPSKELP